jgi:hypothetical protein
VLKAESQDQNPHSEREIFTSGSAEKAEKKWSNKRQWQQSFCFHSCYQPATFISFRPDKNMKMCMSLKFSLYFSLFCSIESIMEGGHINAQCQLKGNLLRRFTSDTDYCGSQLTRLPLSLQKKSTAVWPSRLVTCKAASRADTGIENQTVATAANPLSTLSALSKKVGSKVAAGVVSGTIQAGIFHPWDRALYLSQTNNRCRPSSLTAAPALPAP